MSVQVLSCYRRVMRCFYNANLKHIKENEKPRWKGVVRGYFEKGIPGKSIEQSISIGNQFSGLQENLFSLMQLHERYNIKKLRKLDPRKAAATVGLQLPKQSNIRV